MPPVVCNAVIVGAMLAWESTGFSAAFAGKGGKVGAALLREVNVLAGVFGVEGAADQPAADHLTKADIVEDIASMIITELQKQSLTDAICGDLEKHAYSVNDRISSTQLRTMHIMAGV